MERCPKYFSKINQPKAYWLQSLKYAYSVNKNKHFWSGNSNSEQRMFKLRLSIDDNVYYFVVKWNVFEKCPHTNIIIYILIFLPKFTGQCSFKFKKSLVNKSSTLMITICRSVHGEWYADVNEIKRRFTSISTIHCLPTYLLV